MNNKKDKKVRVIYSTQLARFLAQNNVYWLEAKVNKDDVTKIIFIYEDCEVVSKLIEEYKSIKNK